MNWQKPPLRITLVSVVLEMQYIKWRLEALPPVKGDQQVSELKRLCLEAMDKAAQGVLAFYGAREQKSLQLAEQADRIFEIMDSAIKKMEKQSSA